MVVVVVVVVVVDIFECGGRDDAQFAVVGLFGPADGAAR